MRKYRLLHVIPLMYVGGTELSTKSLSLALMARGHQVSVIANEGPLFAEFRRVGLEMVPGRVHRRDLAGLIHGACDIRRCVRERDIEVVHFQSGFASLMGPLAVGLRNRTCRLVWHCRGLHGYSYSIAARFANSFVDFVIANCGYERDRLVAQGLRPGRVTAIYNIPNVTIPPVVPPKDERVLRELGIVPGAPVVASVGNFYPDRGVQYFLEAVRCMLRRRPDVHFLVVGDGPLRTKLRALAERRGLMDSVKFLGVRRDMEAIYSVTDVLVNPVLSGAGTGNVTAEAMAFAKPVVAADFGGLRELVRHRESGMLVPPRDGQAIADAVLYLLDNPAVARRIGDAARERILSDFTPDRVATAVEKVYACVLGDGA